MMVPDIKETPREPLPAGLCRKIEHLSLVLLVWKLCFGMSFSLALLVLFVFFLFFVQFFNKLVCVFQGDSS